MPQEIERKFLVNKELWSQILKPKGKSIRQGYLHTDEKKTIRVRLKGNEAYLTIKGKTIGATRSEFEYEIPVSEASEMLDTLAISELSKIRYEILFDGKVWEVDEFFGRNQGLLLAEIELESELEIFTLPPWIKEEVTEDPRYYNSNLATNPFMEW